MLRKRQRHWEEQEKQRTNGQGAGHLPDRAARLHAAEATGVGQGRGNFSHMNIVGTAVLMEKVATL